MCMTREQKKDALLRQQLWDRVPGLVDRLISLAEDEDAKPTTIVAAIKEIKAVTEELQGSVPQRTEIVVKVVGG